MKKFHKNALTGLAVSVSAAALLAGGSAFAQDAGDECEIDAQGNEVCADGVTDNDPDEDVTTDIQTNADGSAAVGNAIVVTGSRIRQDTYNSISPLQVLSTEASRDVGEFDAAQILQRSEAASGTQIDATFQGFVLDNGPGSQTLNLRGLGSDRTLLLINGRRLAPAGVEGAPSSPSINLLPTSLIARYDLLLDGASSVYGSDAVAGVGNIVLRNDIDGFELFASGNINPEGAGDDYTISGAFGQTFSNGFFGIGAEYSLRDRVTLGDRPFLRGCDTNYEIDQDGNIYRLGVRDNAIVRNRTPGVTVAESECVQGGISGRIFQPFARFGSVYFPANGNIANFPVDPRTGRTFNFGDSTDAFGVDLDVNNDGVRDVDFQNVNTNGALLDQTFISQQKLYNVMAYGEYSFGGDMNITPFFEALYSRAEIRSQNDFIPQIFPSVPDLNEFNPCNFITNPNGVDCRALDNAFQQINPGQANFGRLGRLSSGFALPTTPIFAIRGDRSSTQVDQEQYRGVLGLRGDLPFIDDSWTFEISGVYSRSEGSSPRFGVREDKLAFALGLDPTADYTFDGIVDNNGDGIADDYDNNLDVFGAFGDPQYIGTCNAAGLANPELAAPDLLEGCVPVNLFAESVLSGAIGDFATQAERDYVFGRRQLDTTYEQTLISGYVTGDVFELPAGPLSVVIGAEYRDDSIETTANFVSTNGLLFGFFRDLGTVGSKSIFETFGEVNVPVFSSDQWGDFEVNASGRFTEEELYGSAFTYSVKAGWRIVPQVLLKASYGTSFRAPNLRENFLGGLTGFTTIFDPCAVPNDAFIVGLGGYQPDLDTRQPEVIENCQREGRDPFRVGIDGEGFNTAQTSSVEVIQQSTLDLDPETSRSFTAGVALNENFGDLDMSFNFNYYSIVVEDAVAELSGQFAVNQCFLDDTPDTASIYCDDIAFDTAPSGRFLVNEVSPGFLNQDKETVKGIDLNANFGYDLALGNDVLELGLNLRANNLIERSSLFITADNEEDFFDSTGRFGFPEWTGRAVGTVGYADAVFTWQVRWIGETSQTPAGVDEFDDAFGNLGTGFFSDTCLGDGTANVEGDGNFCRDVGFADDYFVHTASLRYDFSDFLTARVGVSNVFDTQPPRIDCNELGLCISNTPIGNGYDLDGREFFGSISLRF